MRKGNSPNQTSRNGTEFLEAKTYLKCKTHQIHSALNWTQLKSGFVTQKTDQRERFPQSGLPNKVVMVDLSQSSFSGSGRSQDTWKGKVSEKRESKENAFRQSSKYLPGEWRFKIECVWKRQRILFLLFFFRKCPYPQKSYNDDSLIHSPQIHPVLLMITM